jgi:hypothetical protein
MAPPLSAAPTPKINGNQFVHFGKIADISNPWERRSATSSYHKPPENELRLKNAGQMLTNLSSWWQEKFVKFFTYSPTLMFSIKSTVPLPATELKI